MFMDGGSNVMGSPQESSALHRLWSRRLTLTSGLVEEPELGLLENLFPSAQNEDEVPQKNVNLHHIHDVEQHEKTYKEVVTKDAERFVELDAGLLGDVPAKYRIPVLSSHQQAVVGVWVDPRVTPGFRYRVRPIPEQGGKDLPALFGARAITLLSVGRGYARRMTFEADHNALNDNNNYFWSDSSPSGFAFEIEVVAVGDKFTVHDVNHVAVGSVEVVGVATPQEEVQQVVTNSGAVEKTLRVQVLAKVDWFEGSQAEALVPVTGLAVAVKSRSGRVAAVTRVLNVAIGNHQRRGFTLTPGVPNQWRRTTVDGRTIGDVPTRYTVTGLRDYEMPVVGTYVDPRIIPGFHYKVRPAGGKHHLFGGRPLRLVSVGAGYGKRLTFAPNDNELNASTNYLWSDTHPEGLGFEPRAVHAGMRFSITSAGQRLGEASVFRADNPQREEEQEMIVGTNGTTVIKHIHIDVTCHMTLLSTNKKSEPEAQVVRVSGTAVIAREANQSVATLLRIENIGLDSQLNLLFVTQEAELVFYQV